MVVYVVIMLFTAFSTFYGLLFHRGLTTHYTSTIEFMTFCFLAIGIIALVIANRCLSIKSLIVYLILFELSFANLAWFDSDPALLKIGLFHLINISTVLLMMALLAKKNRNAQSIKTEFDNRMPTRVFYLTFSLLLLIGIPGTASFISEFYLLNSLTNTNILFVAMYVSLIILVAIVTAVL